MDEISRQRKRDYYRVISLYQTHEFNFFDFTNLESEVCCFFFSFSGQAITYSQLKVNSGNRVFRLRRLDHREKLVHQREKSNSSL